MSLPSSSRNGTKTIWAALHTAQGARTKEDLYNFFNNNQNASSHVGIDGRGFDDWIGRERYAWTLLNGNPRSVNAELCGFAEWTRAEWLSEGWVRGCWNPRAMVRHAAAWAKRECEALGIPKRYIGVDGVRRGEPGIIIHWDYSRGTGDGDHWDTGENFPWDVFFADMGSSGGDEEMSFKNAYDAFSQVTKDMAAGKAKDLLDAWRKIIWEAPMSLDGKYVTTAKHWLLGTNENTVKNSKDIAKLSTELAELKARLYPADTFHTVIKGETLFSIAAKYGTSVDALKTLNPSLTAVLQPGDRIRVK